MADLMQNLARLTQACKNPKGQLEYYLGQGK